MNFIRQNLFNLNLCSFRILQTGLFVFLMTFQTTQGQEWKPLFNGKNLDGWTPKIRGYDLGDNFGETFRVEDGLLKVRYDAYDEFNERFGHLFYEGEFSHYRLRVTYRFVDEQSKEVMLRISQLFLEVA